MSKSLAKGGHWGIPEKIKKILGQDLVRTPKIFFLHKLTKENFEKISTRYEGVKIVLISIFP